MIVIENTIISEDIATINFCCDLSKCNGLCCEEGDAGAPLELDEISVIEDLIDKIKPYMTDLGIKEIEKNGVFVIDDFQEHLTPLVNGKECAFVFYNNSTAYCAIEKAYLEKKIKFQKPISCHLYPIRISKYDSFDAINYHQWHVCKDALICGKQKKMPLYQYLKVPLIRKYGKDWYKALVDAIENHLLKK